MQHIAASAGTHPTANAPAAVQHDPLQGGRAIVWRAASPTPGRPPAVWQGPLNHMGGPWGKKNLVMGSPQKNPRFFRGTVWRARGGVSAHHRQLKYKYRISGEERGRNKTRRLCERVCAILVCQFLAHSATRIRPDGPGGAIRILTARNAGTRGLFFADAFSPWPAGGGTGEFSPWDRPGPLWRLSFSGSARRVRGGIF